MSDNQSEFTAVADASWQCFLLDTFDSIVFIAMRTVKALGDSRL